MRCQMCQLPSQENSKATELVQQDRPDIQRIYGNMKTSTVLKVTHDNRCEYCRVKLDSSDFRLFWKINTWIDCWKRELDGLV